MFRYKHNIDGGQTIQRSTPKLALRRRSRIKSSQTATRINVDALLSQVLELLPQGIIVVTRNFKPVYCNQKSKHLCQQLTGKEYSDLILPLPVSEICHRLLRSTVEGNTSIVLECRAKNRNLMRLRGGWLEQALPLDLNTSWLKTLGLNPTEPGLMVVFLENCDEMMQEEMEIQRQKYDLTEREAEIWMLLRQELTYQEIAQCLQISLNTVKTHVKNIYAKQRSCQGQDQFWCHRAIEQR